MKKILFFLLALQGLAPLLQAKSTAWEREQAALAYLHSLEEESEKPSTGSQAQLNPKREKEYVEDSLTGEEKVLLGATALGGLVIVGGLLVSIATSDVVAVARSGIHEFFYPKPKPVPPTLRQSLGRYAKKKFWEYKEKIAHLEAADIEAGLVMSAFAFIVLVMGGAMVHDIVQGVRKELAKKAQAKQDRANWFAQEERERQEKADRQDRWERERPEREAREKARQEEQAARKDTARQRAQKEHANANNFWKNAFARTMGNGLNDPRSSGGSQASRQPLGTTINNLLKGNHAPIPQAHLLKWMPDDLKRRLVAPILGISVSMSRDEQQRVVRKLKAQLHPDRWDKKKSATFGGTCEQAEEAYKVVSEAWSVFDE